MVNERKKKTKSQLDISGLKSELNLGGRMAGM